MANKNILLTTNINKLGVPLEIDNELYVTIDNSCHFLSKLFYSFPDCSYCELLYNAKAGGIIFVDNTKYYNDLTIFDANSFIFMNKICDIKLSFNSFKRTIGNVTLVVKDDVIVKSYISMRQNAIVIYDKDNSENKNNNINKNKNQYLVFH